MFERVHRARSPRLAETDRWEWLYGNRRCDRDRRRSLRSGLFVGWLIWG